MKSRFTLSAAALALALPVLACAAEGGPSFEVYGFAQADYVQDFNRVNPAWDATLRPSRIPTTPGQFGSNNQAIVSARQSRLGAQGSIPTEKGPVTAKFEFDMFGVGVDEGQTTIRLRHAFGTWNHILGGQTNSVFMDVDVFPDVIDYWGPSGMVFLRTPQLRWTPYEGESFMNGKATLALAVEHPASDIDSGKARELDPTLGANITADDKMPDLTAHARYDHDRWGHAQLGAIFRRLGYETTNVPGNDPSGHNLGWGLDMTGNLKTIGKDKFDLAFVYGEGIASYMNDGGTDLAPRQNGPTALKSAPVILGGVLVYYDHYWTDKFESTVGYSRTQVKNTNAQTGTAFHTGQYASGNLVYRPNPEVFFGAEFLWGQRTDNSGAKGIDRRLQFSAHYNFSTKSLFAKS